MNGQLFKEGELVEEQVMRKFGIPEFSIKRTHYYNLDVIDQYEKALARTGEEYSWQR